MFRRVMVANRGEIARRIIRTLHRMKIESVAIFSEADQDASYLREATHAICIGASPAKESYLLEDAILEAALMTESQALHPGFGFLSENAGFAKRCQAQKLTFIGPSPPLIALMGDKARARRAMADLSVKTLRGSDGIVFDIASARDLAESMGYPILLKARAGGGGKGMRLLEDNRDFNQAFFEAQQEAESAFGDGEIYLEKFIKHARHIEFQVLGDNYGNVVCLGERECSIQRKNQKLIEEAPAHGFSDELRQKTAAILENALKKIGYTNAGTVEFLLRDDGELYFMEMNTRIQVEHPVTELVYGLDLVEWQVRIACGEKINFSQKEPHGAAIECRINAEDPAHDFLPTPGVIKKLVLPESNSEGPVRIDTHIEEGWRVAPYYDSMLAKVIVHGKTREDALALMKKTLAAIHIDGVSTTIDFHKSILRHHDFLRGVYDCSFVGTHWPELLLGIRDQRNG